MHVIAQRRVRIDCVDDRLDEIARMRRREAHAPNAGHAPDVLQQSCEIPTGRRRIAITVDVLSEQLNFGISSLRKRAASSITDALVRLRSGPRVNGTTQ